MHPIRLRDPWTCESFAGGGLRWMRRFNRPTGLARGDRVALEIEGLPPDAIVTLNDAAPPRLAPTAAPAISSFDATALLGDANVIAIAIPASHGANVLDADVLPGTFPYAVRLALP